MKIIINKHVHHHYTRDEKMDRKINSLHQMLTALIKLSNLILKKQEMAKNQFQTAFDELIAKVAAEQAAEDSAILLLKDLKLKLDNAIATGDLEQIRNLSAQIGASTDKLAAAVIENTPPLISGLTDETTPPVKTDAAAASDDETAKS